jgi:hypothetical protein
MRRTWVWLLALQSITGAAAAQSPASSGASGAEQQHPSAPAPPDAPHPWRGHPVALHGVLGIATPWGLAGLSAELTPFEYVSVGGGVGSNLLGWQLAAMARARFTPERRSSFYLGAGYSQGVHEQSASSRDGALSLFTGPLTSMGHNPKRGHDWSPARWVNTELGIERREANRIDVRGFLGVAFLLNADAGVAAPPNASQSELLPTRDFMLYAGAALGFWL